MSISYGNVTIPVTNNGTGGTSSNYIWNDSSLSVASDIKSNAINIQGDAVFKGNITWQDRDMREWFESVESRLGMLQPNPEIESTWDELKRLGDQYRALEKKLKEQQQVFDVLKKE